MPFCPSCGSEYREGFTKCPPCGDVALVAELAEHDELSEDEIPKALPVGLASSAEIGQVVEVNGRRYDLMRVWPLDRASEVVEVLDEAGIPCAMVPLEELEHPDQRPRFEVRVRPADHAVAESALRSHWKAGVVAEGVEAKDEAASAEECPACGAHVPLDVEECPECGLMVGAAGDGEDGEDGEDDEAERAT